MKIETCYSKIRTLYLKIRTLYSKIRTMYSKIRTVYLKKSLFPYKLKILNFDCLLIVLMFKVLQANYMPIKIFNLTETLIKGLARLTAFPYAYHNFYKYLIILSYSTLVKNPKYDIIRIA